MKHFLLFLCLALGVNTNLNAQKTMKFSLPQLPYALDALGELMPAHTLEYHYGRHHAAYVNNVNTMIVGTEFEDEPNLTLEDLILRSNGALYNNAAQAWNHTFFFFELSPTPKSKPTGALLTAIERDFGSYDAFVDQFTKASIGIFGSGWSWLVRDKNGKLQIITTPNAGNPARDGMQPLMTADVWEHAYYLDHQNRRAEYMVNFWKLLDWAVVEQRFA